MSAKKHQLLREYFSDLENKQILMDGEVTAVDESDYTCTVKLPNGLELPDILLNSSREATRGAIQIPAIGSYVRILRLNGGDLDWLVISVETIQKIIVLVDDKIQVSAPEIVFNDGKNGGIPISKNIADRLNIVENDLNKLKQGIAAWVVVPQDGGAALKAKLADWLGALLTETASSQIENTKVKH